MAGTREIAYRTTSEGQDKRLILAGSAYARTMSIGNDWTSLRIAMRWSFTRTSTWASSPRWYFGLSSGKSALPGSSYANHFVGISANYLGYSTSHTYWGYLNNGLSAVKVVANAYSYVNSNQYIYQSISARNNMSIIAVEFTKASPNWALALHGASATSHIGTSYTQYMDLLDSPLGTYLDVNILSTAQRSVAVDEPANGNLDTICFSWTGGTEQFEISTIDYVRLA